MASFEEKKAAFNAYQNSGITDEQLCILRASVDDLVETLRAIGESGYHLHGYFHLADSLRHIQAARERYNRGES